MKAQVKEKDERARDQARAQLESIVEMVKAYEEAREADEYGKYEGEDVTADNMIEKMQENALTVLVREGWHGIGEEVKPEEFEILLCTGGPAVRIIGELDEHGQPENPIIQYQDWFTQWEELGDISNEEREALQTYCEQFYFEC